MKAYAFGFPKIGEKREFKKALEDFWKGKITEEQFEEEMNKLRMYMVENYRKNVDVIPSNELSYYDFVLDTAVMVGQFRRGSVSTEDFQRTSIWRAVERLWK